MPDFIYLASQSPRRKQLLEQWGVRCELLLPGAEEDVESLEVALPREAPTAYVRRVTALKLQAAAAYLKRGVSMTEVAAIAGFADLAHFSKLWKQQYGFPPHRVFAGHEVSIDPLPWPSCIERPPGTELGRDAVFG